MFIFSKFKASDIFRFSPQILAASVFLDEFFFGSIFFTIFNLENARIISAAFLHFPRIFRLISTYFPLSVDSMIPPSGLGDPLTFSLSFSSGFFIAKGRWGEIRLLFSSYRERSWRGEELKVDTPPV